MSRAALRRMQSAVLLIMFGVVSLAGLTWQPATAGPASDRVTIRLAGDIDTLDPHLTRSTLGYQFALSMYDRLLSVANGKIVPYLATSWTVTSNSATLTLRKDVTCSDGTQMTASVVAASLRRLGAPETRAPYAARTFGGNPYTVAADDAAGAVTVTLSRPFSDLLLGLAMPWSSIVCAAGLADLNALGSKSFGSGPYVLDRSIRGNSYTLTARSDHTWGPKGALGLDAGRPKILAYRVVSNNTTATNLLLAGGLDIAEVRGRDRERLDANKAFTRAESVSFGTDYLLFNQAEGRPGADRTLRTAMAMAIDRDAYNKAAYAGQAVSITNFITSKVDCFNRATASLVPRYDPTEARAMLQRAGWTAASDGKLVKDGRPITVKVVGYTGQNAGPEYLFEALQKIGVAATLQVLEFGSLVPVYFVTGDWDVTPFPFGPPMPSPNTITPFVSGPTVRERGTNIASIRNSAFDAAAEAGRTTTGVGRCVHWIEAQRAILANVDLVPLVARATVYFGRGIEFRIFSEGVIDPFSIRRK